MKRNYLMPVIAVLRVAQKDVIATSLYFVNNGTDTPKDDNNLIVDLTK